MRKFILLISIMALACLPVLLACIDKRSGDDSGGNAGSLDISATPGPGLADDAEASESDDLDDLDDLGEHDFGGADFTFTSWRFGSCRNEFAFEEETGDLINDSIYKRNRTVENRFNLNIRDIEYQDQDGSVRKNILSGTTAFDCANVRCTEAFVFWCDGLLIPTEEILYLNFAKSYWSQSINKSISINNTNYVAVGALDISTYEQTFALLFNKKLVETYALENPYELVTSGKWTFDKMNDLMKRVLNNLDIDGKQTDDGIYGYMAHIKHAMPGFWIGAGEIIIKKDENDAPYLSMSSERFLSVFNKIFEITWDNNAWYRNTENALLNIPAKNMAKFINDQSLFMDTSFHFIQDLRGMDTDFGILPYPKFDEGQANYSTRLSYYYPLIVPSTCSSEDLEKIGIMLEVLNSESAKTVVPVYYDTALKNKYARDEESVEMIDLIFASRVCDLADSTFCELIRDGFIAGMFAANNRNIVSKIESTELIISSRLENIPNK